MPDIQFSVDIETDGVVAGRNNMLSLGAAAIDMDTGKVVATFKMNLSTVPKHMPDPDTMAWWKLFPEAFVAAREGAQLPSRVMQEFVQWVETHKTKNSVMFAWNPVLDLSFIKYYIHAFHPNGAYLTVNGFFHKRTMGLDLKTLTMVALNNSYQSTKMDSLPDSIRLDDTGQIIKPHNHDAMEDAKEQAFIYYNVMRRLGY